MRASVHIVFAVLLCFCKSVWCDVISRQFNEIEGSVCHLNEKTSGVCRKSCGGQPQEGYKNDVCNPGKEPVLYCCVDEDISSKYPTINEVCVERRFAEEFYLRLKFEEYKASKDLRDFADKYIQRNQMIRKECYERSLHLEVDERSHFLEKCLRIPKPVALKTRVTPQNRPIDPSVAKIGFKDLNADIEWSCLGDFVHTNFLLTSASCVTKERNAPNIVQYTLPSEFSSYTTYEYIIEQIIPHPNYTANSPLNNIAIVKATPVKKDMVYNGPVPVCLWTKKYIPISPLSAVWYTGTQETLNETRIYPGKCSERANMLPEDDSLSCYTCDIEDETIKIGFLKYTEKLKLEVPYLVGIGSTDSACRQDEPAVATNIYPYLEWIESLISIEV